MRLLFSTNQKIGAKLIRWGTEGDCSHFAVEFDECIVMQSNVAQGVNVLSTNEFLEHNSIIHEITFKCSLVEEEQVWQTLIKRLAGKVKYDKMAMVYWGLQILKHRIFGTPYPKTNKWADTQKFMCIELAQELPDFIFGGNKPSDLSLTSPEQLYHLINKSTLNSPYRALEG